MNGGWLAFVRPAAAGLGGLVAQTADRRPQTADCSRADVRDAVI